MSNIFGDSHWPMTASSSVQYYLSLSVCVSVSARPSVRLSVCLSQHCVTARANWRRLLLMTKMDV